MSAQKLAYGFIPTAINNCALWLDGADSSTMFQNTAATTPITTDGQTIAAWRDKSANSYLFTQPITGNQPTYKVGIQNGYSLTRWNGTSSGLQSSTTLPFYTSASSGGSFFFVFMITNNSSQHFLMTYQNQVSGTFCVSESEIGCPTGNVDTGNFGIHQGCSKANVALNQITTNTYVMMNLNLLGSGTAPANTTIYKNGTSATMTAQNGGFYSGTTYPYTNNSRYLNIGYRVPVGTYPIDCWLPGDIAEIIWYQTPVSAPQQQQVEAYLAQKWGLTAFLPPGHPGLTTTIYRADYRKTNIARPIPYYLKFSPTQIAGCIQWLDGADNSTIYATYPGTLAGKNSTVTQWNDKSGAGNHVYQNGAATCPTFTLASNALNFAGGGGLWNSTGYALSSNVSFFTVMISPGTGWGTWGTLWGHFRSGGHDADIQLRQESLTNGYVSWHTNNNNNNYQVIPAVGTLVLYSCTMSNGVNMFLQNSYSGSTTSSTYTEGSMTIAGGTVAPFWIGRSDSSEVYNGYICEIVYYNQKLSDIQRQQVESYLAQKWGLTASLPSGHPHFTQQAGAVTTVALSKYRMVGLAGVKGRTFTFTGYTNSPGAPISYINSSSVTNGATTFSGSAGASETNVFYSYTNDIAAPVAKGVTKNSSRDTINLPANTTGTQTTFLSYGPYDKSYTLAGSMPTGFSTSAHTVIMIIYHLGTTAAIGGTGGEGQANVVTSGGILYQMGRSSVAGNFGQGGQVIVGENGAWDNNAGYSMSINSTTVNIQSKVGWVMVAFVWNAGSTCSYYYNGSTSMSSGGGNGASSMAGVIYIGVDQRQTYYNGQPGNNLNAEVAFYGLWNSALTSTQIGAFYTQHISQFSGGFV